VTCVYFFPPLASLKKKLDKGARGWGGVHFFLKLGECGESFFGLKLAVGALRPHR
jgi:hypothetical protein